MTTPRRAQVVGTGLIGGSVGLALRGQGWHVTGSDGDPAHTNAALARGAVDAVGVDVDAEICFVAVPVGAVAPVVRELLGATRAVVTDVGSVKGAIVGEVADPRFVGGHPMAGSEQDGVAGSRADMFEGATWVLTPDDHTDPAAYSLVHQVVGSFGADVVSMAPSAHDDVVAMVSHVPHLTAATLMGLAARRSEQRAALLRLAAGGFRDMTRISAGSPAIWPDICAENRDAIVEVLDELVAALTDVRAVVASSDRAALLDRLDRARTARLALPTGAPTAEELAEVLVRIPDRPGQLSAITTTATELDINIYAVEIAHSVEGEGGVFQLVVDTAAASRLADALRSDGYHVTVRELG